MEAVLKTQGIAFGIVVRLVAQKPNAGPIRLRVGQFGGHGIFRVFVVAEDADGLKLFLQPRLFRLRQIRQRFPKTPNNCLPRLFSFSLVDFQSIRRIAALCVGHRAHPPDKRFGPPTHHCSHRRQCWRLTRGRVRPSPRVSPAASALFTSLSTTAALTSGHFGLKFHVAVAFLTDRPAMFGQPIVADFRCLSAIGTFPGSHGIPFRC